MAKSVNRQILDKIEYQHELLHKIDTKVAVTVQKIEAINGSIGKHEERLNNHSNKIDKIEDRQSNMEGKWAGISATISTAIAGIGIFISKMWR